MGQKIFQVDAFTDKPFAGNPAGVCVLSTLADESWMQNVAMEMNLAETAFLVREGEGYRLRWFTPMMEVDLCGHATLASAHILWQEGFLASGDQAIFQTRSGKLTADKNESAIWLNFPAVLAEPAEAPPGLLEALGNPVCRNISKNQFDYIVELESEQAVRALTPNMTLLATIPQRGVGVTSRSDRSEFDFVSRFFAPAAGIPEDPVTGSAHCSLGPYWQPILNKTSFTAYQASPRGGIVQVVLAGDRVLLGGQAVTTLRGELV